MAESQFPKNAKRPIPAPPAQQQQDAMKKLGGLFGNKEKQYSPIVKSLTAANIKPRVMDIMIGDEPTECLVIPVQELIYKEWKHITGGFDSNDVVAVDKEREEDESGNSEVG
jgi:hypothetical protein